MTKRPKNKCVSSVVIYAFDYFAGKSKCDPGSPEWTALHAAYEKRLFDNGMSAVKASFENTQRIHTQDRAVGNAFLRAMGGVMKVWNLLTKGKFTL